MMDGTPHEHQTCRTRSVEAAIMDPERQVFQLMRTNHFDPAKWQLELLPKTTHRGNQDTALFKTSRSDDPERADGSVRDAPKASALVEDRL